MIYEITNVYQDSVVCRVKGANEPPIMVKFKPGSREEQQFLTWFESKTLLDITIKEASCNKCKFRKVCNGPAECDKHIPRD